MKRTLAKILAFLHVRTAAAGLEVSDQVVRLVYFDGKAWQLRAERISPGVMVNGVVKDKASFVAVLAALKEQVVGRRKRKSMNVVACLSSAEVYTQTFSLPSVKGKALDEAVKLNLAMVSPGGVEGSSYHDWQSLGHDDGTAQTKILAAFLGRAEADGIADALFGSGFFPEAFESRAFALARVLRSKGSGIDISRSYLFMNIDNVGLDFMIIRAGSLAFEHSERWYEIVDAKGEIAVGRFTAAVAAGVRQVMNFYAQHWTDQLGAIIISTPTYAEETEEAVRDAAGSVPVVRLMLEMGQPISPEWLAALGSSLRSEDRGSKGEREINLLGTESEDRFRTEQLADFLRFWRIAVPAALGILLITFGVADFYLHSIKSSIESRSDFNIGATTGAQTAALESSAQSFNSLVALTANAENMIQPKGTLLDAIAAVASSSHITIDRLVFSSYGADAALSGTGASESGVIAFKTALSGIAGVRNVVLPLTGVQTTGSSVAFSLTFTASPPQGH